MENFPASHFYINSQNLKASKHTEQNLKNEIRKQTNPDLIEPRGCSVKAAQAQYRSLARKKQN